MIKYIWKYILRDEDDKRSIVYATNDKQAKQLIKYQTGKNTWVTKMRVRLNIDQLKSLYYNTDELDHLISKEHKQKDK